MTRPSRSARAGRRATATSIRARAEACTRPGHGPATRRSSSGARSMGPTGCRPRRSPTTRTAGATSTTSTWRPPATAAASPSGTTTPRRRARGRESLRTTSVPPAPELCRVQVGLAVAIAREGCFERQGSLYTAPGDVRLNGIDLSGPGTVAIDVQERTLKTSGPVTAQVGNVKLGSQRLDWRIPGGGRDQGQRRKRGDLRRREGERGGAGAAGLGLDHAPDRRGRGGRAPGQSRAARPR